jgi:hypothetical protein
MLSMIVVFKMVERLWRGRRGIRLGLVLHRHHLCPAFLEAE